MLWDQMQCTYISLLHLDRQLSNSEDDPTENKHMKEMVELLVGENALCS